LRVVATLRASCRAAAFDLADYLLAQIWLAA
jgi:hypothetical protein